MATALFYVFLAIFAATAVVTLLGVTNKVSIKDTYLRVLLGTFLLELSVSVIALYQNVDFFGASATDFIEGLRHRAPDRRQTGRRAERVLQLG